MTKLRSQRGQGVVELVVAAPIVASILAGGAILLYISFAKAWMTRAAREGAVCLQSPTRKSVCRSRVEQTLSVGLPFGAASIDEFQRHSSTARVQIVFHALNSDEGRPRELIRSDVTIRNPN